MGKSQGTNKPSAPLSKGSVPVSPKNPTPTLGKKGPMPQVKSSGSKAK